MTVLPQPTSTSAPGATTPSAPSPAATTPRLDSLTSLRFVAAGAVVLYHAWWPFTGTTDLDSLEYAYTAVGFFFTLSGVVLAWSWRPGTGVRVQWRRRAARILPLHWLMLGVVAAMYVAWPAMRPAADTKAALLTQATLLQAWPPFEHMLAFNYPSWSLSTEAFCYLLFPFLMWGLSRLSVRGLLVLAAGLATSYVAIGVALNTAALPGLSDGGLLALPPLQFLKFAAGACLGAALRGGWRPRVPMWAAAGTLVLAVVLMPVLRSRDVGFALYLRVGTLFPDLVLLVPMMLVVVAAAGRDLRAWEGRARLGWLSRSRLLIRLGEWSFAMYLVHVPLLYLSYAWRTAHPGGGMLGLRWLVVYLVVCVAVAGLLHVLFEKPVERWIRSRERSRRTPVQGSVQVPAPRHPSEAVPSGVGAPT